MFALTMLFVAPLVWRCWSSSRERRFADRTGIAVSSAAEPVTETAVPYRDPPGDRQPPTSAELRHTLEGRCFTAWKRGRSVEQAIDDLVAAGADRSTADDVASAYFKRRAQWKLEAHRKELWWGASILGAGILLTIVTFWISTVQGGTYLVAVGPMVFGAILLVRALSRG